VLRLEGENLQDKQVQCALDEIGGAAHESRIARLLSVSK
jgi:hypothetical protein